MKMNFKVRMRNPWFWVGLISVILTAMGIKPEMLTSWGAVWDAFMGLISNPFLIGTTAVSVLAVFVDPTTKGIKDSNQALNYEKPKDDEQCP